MSLRVRLLFNFPTYKVLAVSIVSIIVGVASISLSVIGLVNQIWGHYVATGIWSGSVIAISGFFGIASAQTRGVCVVKTFMMFSVFSSVVSLGVIALSAGGLVYGSNFYQDAGYRHPNTRLIHGMLLGTGILQAILSLICAGICIKHVCCRPKPKIPTSSADEVEPRNKFRRGDGKGSQSSSAPLMSSGSRQKHQSGSSSGSHPHGSRAHQSESGARHSGHGAQSGTREHHSGSGAHHSGSRGHQSGSDSHNTNSSGRHSGDRNRENKRRNKSGSSERSSSDRGRRHSSEREREQRTSRSNRSPDRYANKPSLQSEIVMSNDTCTEHEQNRATVNNVDRITIDLESHSNDIENFEQLLDNDLEGLPPYEEVIKDNELDDSLFPLSITEADYIDVESVSLSSHDNLSNRASFSGDKDCTETKEIDAEQEALLCLSAALQTPVTSANSGISYLLSDPVTSPSENSNLESENVRRLSTDLVIHSEGNSDDDEKCAPSLSVSERQTLLAKYHTSEPDPQGVMYKGFSRNSNVIKESINDGKPKRSKSFQHTREREFARGKSSSSRHLSYEPEEQNDRQIARKTDIVETESEGKFRLPSRSFSRSSSIPGKAPPKPPRTSSLKQNKERPKSATLPYSQLALLQILDEGKSSDSETKNNDQEKRFHPNFTESTKTKQVGNEKNDNYLRQIQPPKFRYPRPKLTNTTFQEFKKSPEGSKSTQRASLDLLTTMIEGLSQPISKDLQPSVSTAKTTSPVSDSQVGDKKGQDSLLCKHTRDSMTLPLVTRPSSSGNETQQSPIKSPTDYSAIPLKDILMKGQNSSKTARRLSDLDRVSSSSGDASSEESSSAKSAAAEAEMNNDEDRDIQNQSDTEGKPMYSFLL